MGEKNCYIRQCAVFLRLSEAPESVNLLILKQYRASRIPFDIFKNSHRFTEIFSGFCGLVTEFCTRKKYFIVYNSSCTISQHFLLIQLDTLRHFVTQQKISLQNLSTFLAVLFQILLNKASNLPQPFSVASTIMRKAIVHGFLDI